MRLAVAIPLSLAVAVFVRGAWHLRTCRRPGIGAARLVAAALLFWWPALGAGPRLARAPHPAARVVYLVLGAIQNTALGLFLSSRPEPLYASYAATAPAWGLTADDDQTWGGLLMWSVGSAVDMAAVLY